MKSLKQIVGSGLIKAGLKIVSKKGASLQNFDSLRRIIGGSFFGSVALNWLDFANTEDCRKAWEQCPPLVAIITGKAAADNNGKIKFQYLPDGDGKGEMVNLNTVKYAEKLSNLFSRPNPLQTWKQFRAQQVIYKQLYGWCAVLTVKPPSFTKSSETRMMWNLSPEHVRVRLTGKLLYQSSIEGIIESIKYIVGGEEVGLQVADVIFLKDNYISRNQGILPDSRVKALTYPISNAVKAYEASNVLLSKYGALGILSSKSGNDEHGPLPLDEGEVKKIQEQFSHYGLSESQWQILITEAAVEWQQIALPIKDLLLFETIADATRQMCDNYGYYYELMANEKGATYANKKEAKASLYQNTTIPEAEADFESYNEYFGLNELDYRMVYDFSHVEELQKSKKEEAEVKRINVAAAKEMLYTDAITMNRYREILGEKTFPGDDVVWSEYKKKKGLGQSNNNNNSGNEQQQQQ